MSNFCKLVVVLCHFFSTTAVTISSWPGNSANMTYIEAVWQDSNGYIFTSHGGNDHARKFLSDGTCSVFAGTGSSTSSPDGSVATSTNLNYVKSLWADTDGTTYIVEMKAHKIRKVDSSTTVVSTLAGSGSPSYSDGTGTNARFSSKCNCW